MTRTNALGQPIGDPIEGWSVRAMPPAERHEGRTATLEPLDPEEHAPGLYAAFADAPDSIWTYMSFGPFRDLADFRKTLEAIRHYPGWVPFTVLVGGAPLGFASYLRIQPEDGALEIGSITWSPELQRTAAGTEALYLMIRGCFELGYRRCEWKCDALNEPSRRAAERLGFEYEGTFRQATVYKDRNRDTAWYSITDRDWPAIDSALQAWLAADNFDSNGSQRRTLRQVREGKQTT